VVTTLNKPITAMIFEKTFKILNWYFKGMISSLDVWIEGYYSGTETVGNTKYKVWWKKISIIDSKSNRRFAMNKIKEFYKDYDLKNFQNKIDFNSDYFRAESAHYSIEIYIDESKLGNRTLSDLQNLSLQDNNYIPYLKAKTFNDWHSYWGIQVFKLANCLTVEISNSGSSNKANNGVDILPYRHSLSYPDQDGTISTISKELKESDCNKKARKTLLNEVHLYIGEIINIKSKRKLD
jgi:hypothetical protein